jgi:hypothetical protein
MSFCSNITAGRPRGCGTNTRGGIKHVDLASWSAATAGGYVLTLDANDQVTEFSQTGNTFYRFEMPRNQASFNVTSQYGDGNGSIVYQTDMELVFFKNEYLLRKSAVQIIEAETVALVTTVDDDRTWFVGDSFGLTSTASAFNWGAAFTDSNEVRITLTTQEAQPPYEVEAAFMDTIEANPAIINTTTVLS